MEKQPGLRTQSGRKNPRQIGLDWLEKQPGLRTQSGRNSNSNNNYKNRPIFGKVGKKYTKELFLRGSKNSMKRHKSLKNIAQRKKNKQQTELTRQQYIMLPPLPRQLDNTQPNLISTVPFAPQAIVPPYPTDNEYNNNQIAVAQTWLKTKSGLN